MLEQYEEYGCDGLAPDSIRRALAIAQAVEERRLEDHPAQRADTQMILRRADELLAKQYKEES